MLLSYNLYFQHINTTSTIELNAENNLTSNCFATNFELLEEAQITYATVFLSEDEVNTEHKHFYATCRVSPPYFTVWQPPKLA